MCWGDGVDVVMGYEEGKKLLWEGGKVAATWRTASANCHRVNYLDSCCFPRSLGAWLPHQY
jgi:hypothetical protein